MSETKKEPNYIEGIRIFNKNESAPCWNGVITPNQLFEYLKSGKADKCKTEYQGNTQFKFSLWVNQDGSASITKNEYQPPQTNDKKEEPANDLPF